MKCPGLAVFTIDRLLDMAPKKLGMSRAARKLYLIDGTVVLRTEQLQNGDDVIVSAGEPFVKPRWTTTKPSSQTHAVPSKPAPKPPSRKMAADSVIRTHTKAAVRILCGALELTCRDSIIDPCGAFDGPVCSALIESGCQVRHTNDINTGLFASTHDDATDSTFWMREDVRGCDWVVSRPPAWLASKIMPHALQASKVGVAMLLHGDALLTGAEWLVQHPPSVVCLPLDGTARRARQLWLVWDKTRQRGNVMISKARLADEMQQVG